MILTLKIALIVIAILLTISILTQVRGVGLSESSGGSSFNITRRGSEKVLFVSTIILSVLFVLIAFVIPFAG